LQWQEWQLVVLKEGEFFAQLYDALASRVRLNVDDWLAWTELIDAGLKIGKQADLRELISDFIKSHDRVRGPNLAAISLFQRTSSTVDMVSSIQSYFQKFGSKKVVVSDIISQVPRSSVKDVRPLLELFVSHVKSKSADQNSALAAHQLLHYYKPDSSGVADLFQLYTKSIADGVLDTLKDTEDGPVDGALSTIVEKLILFGSQNTEKASECILQAVYVALFGISKRKFSQSCKLWAVRLLCHPALGAVNMAFNIFRSLDVKQIQWESLGHYLLDDSLRYGDWDIAKVVAGSCFTFHVSYQRDVRNLIIRSTVDYFVFRLLT
jgi:N-terminal acetyltransferase B complex non-catalytic subunit